MREQSEERALVVEEDAVVYRYRSGGWRLPVDQILVIGEATTPNGPWVDDYWLCFVTRRDGTWHEASFYAAGRDEALMTLSQRMGTRLNPRLCNSTTFRSRVMWPPALLDEPLFEHVPSSRISWWQSLLRHLGLGGGSVMQRVTPQVLSHLARIG